MNQRIDYPLVEHGDSVVKKLLFRPGDRQESQADNEETSVVLPMEAE